MSMQVHSLHEGQAGHGSHPPAPPTLKDPVCGMTVTAQLQHQLEHAGRPYYFCSAKCKGRFAADPQQYVTPVPSTGTAAPRTAAPAGTIYTCPMHPEVRQDHPGRCPKCGMTLEPELPTLDEVDNPELRDFQRRFWWILPLTAIVFVLAMFGHRLQLMEAAVQTWVEMVLALTIALWAGWPFFVRGWQSLVNRSPNMWTLIGLGTGAAFVYSVVATVAPQVFPASFIVMGSVAVYH